MRSRLTILFAVLTLALTGVGALAAGPAWAVQEPAWADCNANARLTHHYTPGELQSALATMPADVREYTNCVDVIHTALLAALGHTDGSGSGGSGGSFLPTPVVVVLVLLLLAAAALGGMALRRRREDAGGTS